MRSPIGVFLFTAWILTGVPLQCISAKEGQEYEFFVFDNGVGRGQWTPEKQATVLKELGYDGISYNYTTTEALADWLRAFDAHGLRIFGLYVPSWIGQSEHLPKGLEAAIRMLKGRDTVIWLNMYHARKTKGDSDEEAVEVIRQVASWAERSGLRVALYGHKDLYIETAEDGLRLVRKVRRKHVGCSINLCHELMYGNGDRLREIVQLCVRHLVLVSINGADHGGKPDGYIQTLGQGSYDVLPFLQALKQAGYKGPVGLQCYNIPGDIVENLKKSMRAWRGLQQRVFQQGER
jgi:sugar phosphate isomerase/epimerase